MNRMCINCFQHLILCITVSAFQQLLIQTHPSYLTVNWRNPAAPPPEWGIVYKVLGTSYHSYLPVAGNESSVNISTTNYPGVFYSVELYSVTNGSRAFSGRGLNRAACSMTIETHVDDVYRIESPGYPNSPIPGQICHWTFKGSNQTWYSLSFDDLDFGDGQSCHNYLLIEKTTVCDNGTLNDALLVPSSEMTWQLVIGKDFGGKGFRINVTALYKMEAPENVSAILSGNLITLTWKEPNNHPSQFFYVVRVAHYPHTSHFDVTVPGNITTYDKDVTQHAGQNFTLQVRTSSVNGSSAFSDPITIQTNCDKDIYIRQLQTITLTSVQFPFQYLAGVNCHYNFRTSQDNYIKITVNTFDIDGGTNCVHASLEVKGLGKYCSDSPPSASKVIASSTLAMDFVTGKTAHGKGFNITIKSVARPPGVPTHVRTRTEPGKVYLHWTPPAERTQHITGYQVQYATMPSSATTTVFVPKNSTSTIIHTNQSSGRLFMFRVASTSEGGSSNFSKPHFARASCGSSFHLSRSAVALIMSPHGQNNKYQPDMLCRWSVSTDSPLWIHVEIEKLNLESSVNCTKDLVEVSSIGNMCEHNLSGVSYIVKHRQINISFISDFSHEHEGFILKITSVGPSPSEPNNVRLETSTYSLILSWDPPLIHRRYLTGYIVYYRIYGNNTAKTVHLPPKDKLYAIDTTNAPGSLYQVWIQAEGDVGAGVSSDTVTAYAACGQNFTLNSIRTYITSPHYPERYGSNMQCQWNIFATEDSDIRLTFVRVDLANEDKNCTDAISVSDVGVICNDSVENRNIVINDTRNFTITFKTDDKNEGKGFMILLEKISRITKSPKSSRISMSRSVHLEPSPATLLGSSATTLVVTGALTSSLVSSDTIVSDSPSFDTTETSFASTSLTRFPFMKSFITSTPFSAKHFRPSRTISLTDVSSAIDPYFTHIKTSEENLTLWASASTDHINRSLIVTEIITSSISRQYAPDLYNSVLKEGSTTSPDVLSTALEIARKDVLASSSTSSDHSKTNVVHHLLQTSFIQAADKYKQYHIDSFDSHGSTFNSINNQNGSLKDSLRDMSTDILSISTNNLSNFIVFPQMIVGVSSSSTDHAVNTKSQDFSVSTIYVSELLNKNKYISSSVFEQRDDKRPVKSGKSIKNGTTENKFTTFETLMGISIYLTLKQIIKLKQ